MSRHKQPPLHTRNWEVLGSMEDIDDVMVRFEKLRHPPRESREELVGKGQRMRTKFHRQRSF